MNFEKHKFLCELGPKQGLQTFFAVIYSKTCTLRHQRPGQAITFTFKANFCSTALVNACSYTRGVFGLVRKEGLFFVMDVPTVFDVSMERHYLNPVHIEVKEKR